SERIQSVIPLCPNRNPAHKMKGMTTYGNGYVIPGSWSGQPKTIWNARIERTARPAPSRTRTGFHLGRTNPDQAIRKGVRRMTPVASPSHQVHHKGPKFHHFAKPPKQTPVTPNVGATQHVRISIMTNVITYFALRRKSTPPPNFRTSAAPRRACSVEPAAINDAAPSASMENGSVMPEK